MFSLLKLAALPCFFSLYKRRGQREITPAELFIFYFYKEENEIPNLKPQQPLD
jgi:hypothetical protein